MSCSANFVLDKKITSLDGLAKILNNQKSIYYKHRTYPTSFIRNWQIHHIMIIIKRGLLWTIKPKKK